jgi:hypothetical protein
MTVEMAPGPARRGTPSGVTETSSLATPSRSSSSVSFILPRSACRLSKAMRRRIRPPATRNEGSEMPKTVKMWVPKAANTARIPPQTRQPRRAMRIRDSAESVGVMAKKTGTAATGLMMAKSGTPVSRAKRRRSTGRF